MQIYCFSSLRQKILFIHRGLFPWHPWRRSSFQVGGPNFIALNDSTIIAGSRSYLIPGSYKTMLLKGGLDGRFEQIAVLPSGGDTSYPGFLVVGDELWVSYYSSHSQSGGLSCQDTLEDAYSRVVKYPAISNS